MLQAVPIVRCRLDGPEAELTASLRYIVLNEFELWRHLMETRHGRRVTVEAVSVWLAEDVAGRSPDYAAEGLEAVLRLQIEMPGPEGVGIVVERFFPAETYPKAQRALLAHFSGSSSPRRVVATPGYFIPPELRRSDPVSTVA